MVIVVASFVFGAVVSMLAWNWPPHEGWKFWQRWPWS
jgi:hypothetical protein